MNKYKQYMDNSEYEFVPYDNKNKFTNGGEVPREFATAEVELNENSIAPNGEFTQYNGASHEQGGIPVNMEPGERIYSDRLKVPGTKKTFAELNKKNNTNKQDKILEDDKATGMAKSTAKLVADIKKQKSDRLFQEQEMLKQSKVQAYAKKMGLDIGNTFAMGGTKLPKYGDGDTFYPTPNGQPIQQQTSFNPYLTPAEQAQRATYDGNTESSSMMNDFNQENPGFYDMSKYNQAPNPQAQSKSFNYGQVIEPLVNTGLQNAGNIWDLNQTKMGKKYDREDSGQLTPERLNPKEAVAGANVEARVMRNRLKDVTGGNVGSYLSNLTATQANNTMNKAKIYSDFENANVSIGNDFMKHNQSTRMLDKANEQQNKARSEDMARMAIRGIGENTSAAYKNYKQNDMDQYSLDIISKQYPDYIYDKNKRGWFHKNTGAKLKPKG